MTRRASGALAGLRWRRALPVGALFGADPTWAHGALGDGDSFLTGALHLMGSPAALVALVGLVVAFFGCRERLALLVALLAGGAAGVAAAFGLRVPANIAALAAPAAAVAVGLVAVAAVKAPDLIAVVLAVAVGVSAGIAAGLDAPGWGSAFGVSCAVTALVGFTLAASQDLMAVRRIAALLPLARRVLGAWVAAIGVLTGTLALHLQRG